MALIFYKKPIVLGAKTLKTLTDNASSYTKSLEPCENDELYFNNCSRAADLITEMIIQIRSSKDSLQRKVDKMQARYDQTSGKDEKKELLREVVEIEKESKYPEIMAAAIEMIYMLDTRLTEANYDKTRLAKKLGITLPDSTKSRRLISRKLSGESSDQRNSSLEDDMETMSLEGEFFTEDESDTGRKVNKTIATPKIALPKFFGVEEEFSEFWAVFDTLVHSNKSMSTVEKMLFLKDCLKGGSQNALKGIQSVPQNYTWMVETLKKKYGNKPINRSRIVQRLVNMRTATNTADDCVTVLDKVKMLINLMVSAGHDIRKTEDPIWTETILNKFPNAIVKKVLLEIQEKEEVTIENVIDSLEKQVNAKVYVDTRLNASKAKETRTSPYVRMKVAREDHIVTTSKYCDPPNFCEYNKGFLSKALLGNPHCWPEGAIVSAAVIIAIVLSLIVAIATFGMRKFIASRGRRNSLRISTKVRRPGLRQRQESVIELSNFKMTTLNRRYIPVAALIVLSLLSSAFSGASACQHGYMRHTADLVCENKEKCFYSYNREVLFNRVFTELCIQIRHNNQTIGTIKIIKRPMELTCSKVSMFFTRDTEHKIFHEKRCPQMGSCIGDKCATLKPNEIVPELERSADYPGYSTCENTCSGLTCGCLLPFPACTFFRIAHVPKTKAIYEVIRCVDWKPKIPIDLEVTLYNKERKHSIMLTPYITEKFGEFSMNVISVQKPHFPILDRRFATTQTETLVIPENYRLPVECENLEMAKSQFRNCTNRMICACEGAKTLEMCNCPDDSILDVRNSIANRLPTITPTMEMTATDNEIKAFSHEGEVLISIESALFLNSANFIVDQPCIVEFGNVTGC
ncbi:hypothetical protein OESDEN_11238 [Oesophagostomum dentatum]|uniref:Phlebovirus glycoprotein G2 fusion domain-containing protein n=1 Tax=Oesophagostomum dentatum TaxID=61180 RepID=A0A0B1SZL6_OESDE|nr:hypothetical protein OESDEN_11238 [Oesophagostomum dentatum]